MYTSSIFTPIDYVFNLLLKSYSKHLSALCNWSSVQQQSTRQIVVVTVTRRWVLSLQWADFGVLGREQALVFESVKDSRATGGFSGLWPCIPLTLVNKFTVFDIVKISFFFQNWISIVSPSALSVCIISIARIATIVTMDFELFKDISLLVSLTLTLSLPWHGFTLWKKRNRM